ncbi:hypothetical protein ACSBR2_006012 [Camellia fascicularis]
MEDDRDWGPKPFRFLNAWASHPNFLRVVKEAWSRCALQGWAGYKVSLKFKEVKASLKQWNKEEFGNLNDKLSLIEDQLHFIDLLQERNTLSDNDMQIKRILKSEYWKILRLIKITWLQKSRQIWFKEGDKNSKICHMVASSRQRKNSFGSLNLNGSTVEDPEQIKFILGNGKRIKFWTNGWLFNSPLSSLYPRLFSLATDKDYFVCQYLTHQNLGTQLQWSISYRRPLRAWEEDMHHDMLGRLQQVQRNRDPVEDKLIWTPLSSGAIISCDEFIEDSCTTEDKNIRMKRQHLGRVIWEAFPLAILWTIWIARNEKVFNCKEPIWVDLLENIKINVEFWVKQLFNLPEFSIHDFLFCLHGIKGYKARISD